MMTSRDRAELLAAAVIGAVLGGVTGYLLSSLVESGGWLKILIWPLIGHWLGFLSSGCSFVNASAPPLPATSRTRVFCGACGALA